MKYSNLNMYPSGDLTTYRGTTSSDFKAHVNLPEYLYITLQVNYTGIYTSLIVIIVNGSVGFIILRLLYV